MENWSLNVGRHNNGSGCQQAYAKCSQTSKLANFNRTTQKLKCTFFTNYLSVSCLQMVVCHNFMHFCAVSLKILKSSREQGVLSSGHCSRCSIVCVSVPQLHEGSPVRYPHLIKFSLVWPTPDLIQLTVSMLARVHCFLEEDSQIVEFPYLQRMS